MQVKLPDAPIRCVQQDGTLYISRNDMITYLAKCNALYPSLEWTHELIVKLLLSIHDN